MSSCLFCKIASKDIPAAAIYEDGTALAFLDIHPIALGHTVVIPKKHAETVLEVPDGDMGPLFLAVKTVTDMLRASLGTNAFTIGINHGRISGQAVEHLHIHIIPRFEGDGGRSIHSVVNNPPEVSLEEVQRKIIGK